VKDDVMKYLKSAAFVLLATTIVSGSASAAGPASVVGKWRTPSRHGVVEIDRCGASLCGKLIESDNLRTNPDLRDVNNKDTAKRARKLKDLQILGGFTSGKDGWNGGTIYNPEDGGTYKATITSAGNDTLKLKGCIVWPLCKTQTWTRLR
jgi:uncharacterized protein (DUF2147 family)